MTTWKYFQSMGRAGSTRAQTAFNPCEGTSRGPGSLCRVLGPQQRIYNRVLGRPPGQPREAAAPSDHAALGLRLPGWDRLCTRKTEALSAGGTLLPSPTDTAPVKGK